MTRVLCCCEEGNNRSVTVAQKLKYAGFDTLPAGFRRNEPETLNMLYWWADRILLTEAAQRAQVPSEHHHKIVVWDVGPDVFPRPFNPILLEVVQRLMRDRLHELREEPVDAVA